MDPEAKLEELGLELPKAPDAFASYRPAVESRGMLYIAGQGPVRDGEVTHRGLLDSDLRLEEGQEAAELSALNTLAVARKHLGSLDRIEQVVACTVYVASTPDFGRQPEVADGATDLFHELWGERGLPARAAVGAPSLPLGIPVEVQVVFELKDA